MTVVKPFGDAELSAYWRTLETWHKKTFVTLRQKIDLTVHSMRAQAVPVLPLLAQLEDILFLQKHNHSTCTFAAQTFSYGTRKEIILQLIHLLITFGDN